MVKVIDMRGHADPSVHTGDICTVTYIWLDFNFDWLDWIQFKNL